MKMAEMEPEVVPQTKPADESLPRVKEPGKRNFILQQLFELLGVAGLALISYLFVSHFVLQSVQVVGASMLPTLHNSDRRFLNRWIYYVRAPKRGDVVVIKDPTDGTYAVKRIIAVSGDTIYLKDGSVYVNGEKLKEAYLHPGTSTQTCAEVTEEMISCGTERYFVMGDNRENSFDSRYYGTVPRENIVGVVNP